MPEEEASFLLKFPQILPRKSGVPLGIVETLF
jgi:hypothetical protein